MEKWNEKTKRRVLAGGLAILGICLIIGISMQLRVPTSKSAETMAAAETEESIAVIPETTTQEVVKETTTEAVTVEPTVEEIDSQTTEVQETQPVKKETAAAKPAATQNIQPDVTKPAPQTDINDPTKMPDGTPVESAPVPVPHEEVTPTEAEGQLQGGETNSSGQVYVPGFGWQTPSGGEGSYAADMYEDGHKIGIMD